MNKEQPCHEIAIAMTANLANALNNGDFKMSDAEFHFALLQQYKTSYKFLLEVYDSVPPLEVSKIIR